MGIYSINDIDMVILTGGHSQWYFVNEFLAGNQLVPDGRDISPNAIKTQRSNLLQLSNPSETVALGLVYCSHIKADYNEGRQWNIDGTKVVRGKRTTSKQAFMMKEVTKKDCELAEEDTSFLVKDTRCSKENFEKYKEVNMDNNLKLNLLVAGKTGVGKTTLINTIFNAEIGEVRDDKPATMEIEKLSIPYFPITIYDVQGFELNNTEATMKMIKNEISKEQATVKAERLIHAILYCINSSSRRFEAIDPNDKSRGQEERFIRQLASEYKVPVFIIFTQAYAMKTNDNDTKKLENLISSVKACNMPVQGYYPLLCERTAGVDPFGVNDLVQDLLRVLPTQMADLVAGARERALKIKHDKATNWIWGYAATNFALGAVIPAGADVAYLMGIESVMAVHITAILYKDTNVDAKDIIADVVAVCGGPLLGTVGGQIAFNEVCKVGSYIITVFTGGLGAGAAVAAAFAGGLVAAAITVALGRTYLFIAEGLITGKIDKEKIKNKDPKTMQQITGVMQQSYYDARKQVEHDERFSKSNFKKNQKK